MAKSFLPNFIKAQSEQALRLKLRHRQVKLGVSFKIISIYKEGKNIVAWFYDETITQEDIKDAFS